METSSHEKSQPAQSHSSGLMLVFSAVIWKEINRATKLWTSIFPVEPTLQDQVPQKINTSVFCLRVIYKWQILKCTVFNGMFHNVCALHVKLKSRLFVWVRMSCLWGQSRHELRKRDVASVDCWAGSQPVRNRFLLTQLSVWTMFAVITLQRDIYSKHRRTGTAEYDYFWFGLFTEQAQQSSRRRPLCSGHLNWFSLLSL